MKQLLIVITGFLSFHYSILCAQPGAPDSDFDADGKVSVDLSGNHDYANDVKIQEDGKIVVIGQSNISTDADFSVVRYLPNGSLDESFSFDGKVITDIQGGIDYASSFAFQSDGKIVVVGSSSNGVDFDVSIVRYNSDGSLDNTFNETGILISPISTDTDYASTVNVQSDGKIVVAGSSGTDCFIARYFSNGSIDSTFGTDGNTIIDFGEFEGFSSSVIQPDGKIVAAGSTVNISEESDIILVRFNADGTPDDTFGEEGKVVSEFYDSEEIYSIALQSDGKIIVTGTVLSFIGISEDVILIRYNSNGSLDDSFASSGIEVRDINNQDEFATSVALQSDGKILVAGTIIQSNPDYDFLLLRYNSDGTPDDSFGENGIVTTDFSEDREYGHSVAIQPDGRIVMAGKTRGGPALYNDFAIARYLSGLNVGVLNFMTRNNLLLVYPNPVIQSAMLEFTLDQEEVLSIELYDLQGMLIKTFNSGLKYSSGTHQVPIAFDQSITTGNYILTISNRKTHQNIQIMVK